MCGVKILEAAKFIQKQGFEFIISLAVIMLVVSGGVFYFYAWRAADYVQNSQIENINVKSNTLDEVVQDMQSRAIDLMELKQSPLSVPDIFQ